MRTAMLFALAIADQLTSGISLAQSDKDKPASGHHYQGGAKTVVPHHMQDMTGKTTGSSVAKPKASHGYRGGVQSPVPHTMEK